MQNSIVCSICKKDKTIITDLDSGEIACSKCGQVISDKIQDTRRHFQEAVKRIRIQREMKPGEKVTMHSTADVEDENQLHFQVSYVILKRLNNPYFEIS